LEQADLLGDASENLGVSETSCSGESPDHCGKLAMPVRKSRVPRELGIEEKKGTCALEILCGSSGVGR
jgi:hypothetical protein